MSAKTDFLMAARKGDVAAIEALRAGGHMAGLSDIAAAVRNGHPEALLCMLLAPEEDHLIAIKLPECYVTGDRDYHNILVNALLQYRYNTDFAYDHGQERAPSQQESEACLIDITDILLAAGMQREVIDRAVEEIDTLDSKSAKHHASAEAIDDGVRFKKYLKHLQATPELVPTLDSITDKNPRYAHFVQRLKDRLFKERYEAEESIRHEDEGIPEVIPEDALRTGEYAPEEVRLNGPLKYQGKIVRDAGQDPQIDGHFH